MPSLQIPVTENPRWTRCRAAIGREPKPWEFIIWVGWCWADFYRHEGVKSFSEARHKIGLRRVHDAFDAFQEAGVAAGRWPTPDGHLPPLSDAESASDR